MKKGLKAGAVLILVALAVYVGISWYVGYSETRVVREPIQATPSLIGLTFEDISFKSVGDSLTLRGWFLSCPGSDRAIILVHGINSNRLALGVETLALAQHLVGHGYNVLMFDLRAHGESGGNMVSGGYYEKRDVEGAVGFVKERGIRHIGVLGFSLGAASSILAAAEDKDIEALVSDSCYATLFDVVGPRFAKRTHAPQALLHPILFAVKLMFGVDFEAIKPVDTVRRISPRPMMFIHGDQDDGVPVADAEKLFEACDNPKSQLWLVPGAGHTKAYAANPQGYLQRIDSFFDSALSPEPTP